jgi:4-alpha-glucanotransferase
MKLFNTLKNWFGELPVIAEDLGILTPTVHELLAATGFPGMKVLEFAFDASGSSIYLPHNYKNSNCVVYTGTHDNDTVRGWFEKMEGADLQFTTEYMDLDKTEAAHANWKFIRLALSSIADLAIIPVQDYLGLNSSARINEPGTVGTNWRWRMLDGELTREIAQKCRRMARLYGRY